jgi:hypothetical protein
VEYALSHPQLGKEFAKYLTGAKRVAKRAAAKKTSVTKTLATKTPRKKK